MRDRTIDCPRCEGRGLDTVDEPCDYCKGRAVALLSWFAERDPYLLTPEDRAALLADEPRCAACGMTAWSTHGRDYIWCRECGAPQSQRPGDPCQCDLCRIDGVPAPRANGDSQ